MIRTLHDDQHIALQILVRDIPGLAAGLVGAADAESLALSERVIHEAAVATDDAALGRLDAAGLRRQILFEELLERALADEADAGAVLLVEHGQGLLLGNAAHLILVQIADGKERAGEGKSV